MLVLALIVVIIAIYEIVARVRDCGLIRSTKNEAPTSQCGERTVLCQ